MMPLPRNWLAEVWYALVGVSLWMAASIRVLVDEWTGNA